MGSQMQFISARQAWHDAFDNSADSTLASGLEARKLGVIARSSGAMSGNWKKTKEGSTDNGKFRDDSGKQIHRARAGLVQCAITRLPERLRRFGMYLYAPVSFITIEDGEEAVAAVYQAVYKQWFSNLPEKPNHSKYQDTLEVLPFLIRAFLMRHKQITTFHKDPFVKPKELRTYLYQEYGVEISPQNFTRDWGKVIDLIKTEIDRLDKASLVPVSKVVETFSYTRVAEGKWNRMAWDVCFDEIDIYCGQVV